MLCPQRDGELIVTFTERWRVNCLGGELIVTFTERWRVNCYVHREMGELIHRKVAS